MRLVLHRGESCHEQLGEVYRIASDQSESIGNTMHDTLIAAIELPERRPYRTLR